MDYSHVCAKKWGGEVFTFGSCCSKFSFGNFVQYMLLSAFCLMVLEILLFYILSVKQKKLKQKNKTEGEREESLSSQPSTTIQSFINSDSTSCTATLRIFLFLGMGRSQTSVNPKQNGATSFSVCSC